MSKVTERKRRRWEYLKKKGATYSNVALYSALFVPALTIAGLCGIAAVMILFIGPNDILSSLFAIGLLLGCGLSGALSWYCRNRILASQRQARQLSYVPPVTPKTLPAEEILVRGSEEPPVQQSEVLLRAAKPGQQEMSAEELLRASQE
jgi:hypothetical protein